MKKEDFYFDLPPELIAQTPIKQRDHSRLMLLDRRTGKTGHLHFYELPKLLRPGDCLVLNDSRVLPARLYGKRRQAAPSVLLLVDRGNRMWSALRARGGKAEPGTRLIFGDGSFRRSSGKSARAATESLNSVRGHFP